MPRHLRIPLSGKTTKKRGNSLLQAARSRTQDVDTTKVESRVSESKRITQKENSDIHAHPFHFSAVTKHQMIAYREKEKTKMGRQKASKRGPPRWTAQWASLYFGPYYWRIIQIVQGNLPMVSSVFG